MRAGFFRRLTSSLIDMTIVFTIIYLSFILFGRGMLQDKIENYDEINAAYQDIMLVYNENVAQIQKKYEVAKELAGEDEDLLSIAFDEYVEQTAILNNQNNIDTEPYIYPLGIYFTNVIYYYMFLFLILTVAFSLSLKGLTLGRRVMKLKLSGPVNIMSVFLHDIVFKYLLIVILIPINVLFAIMLLMFMALVDTGLIAATKNKLTIRDMISKITVDRTENKY
ncbi:MAG: RDD family protein [Candidatus Izemoplasmatales bacterium]|nr:RDD family protein [Candidatus Izemoplasmatales bacterium]